MKKLARQIQINYLRLLAPDWSIRGQRIAIKRANNITDLGVTIIALFAIINLFIIL